MGNYRFRLSDMMPNAWFYKLKDMNKPKTQNTPTKKRLTSSSNTTTSTLHHKQQQQQQPFHQYSQSRNSCYYTPRVDHFYINSPTTTITKNLPKPPSNNTHFPPPLDPPRKSSKRSRTKRKTIYKPSPKHTTTTTLNSAAWTHHQHQTESARSQFQEDHDFFHSPNSTNSTTTSHSPHDQPDHHDDHSPSTESTRSLNGLTTSRSSSCSCRVSSSATDIIIDMNNGDHQKPNSKKVDRHMNFDGVDLPPILTKPPSKPSPQSRKSQPKLDENDRDNTNSVPADSASLSIKIVKENNTKSTSTQNSSRKSVSYSTGMKLRSNSPRIELISKKVNSVGGRKSSSSSSQRKSFSRSMAIVKSSCDPQKDFRESMVEMIVENNIRASQDLEELLACYLTLNSDEYHDLIVKAFEQIWFNLPGPHPS